MLYYFFALAIAAAILLFNNLRSETNRWAALFLFSASIGGWTDVLSQAGWTRLSDAVQFINHTVTPYGVLMFSIVYSEQFARRRSRIVLKWLLLAPVILMAVQTLSSPAMSLDFRWLLSWVGPYYLISCYLLLRSLWREQDRRKKRSRLITTIIIVPTLVAVLILINIARVITPDFDFFKYVSVFIVYSFAVALLCTFVYSVLGVKLRFERDPLESTMQAVSSGTALLNHTIKNELGKIAISVENIKRSLSDDDNKANAHLRIISNASDHMQAMVHRIHSQLKEIVLREEPVQLVRLIDESVAAYEQVCEHRGIRIRLSYACTPIVRCDAVHMKEVIGNVLNNAIEAMNGGGELTIRLDVVKKRVRLSIEDTGCGIPADQLERVLEPFYSTKLQRREAPHFGLGLSYVHNVMQRSGGFVDVKSEEGVGTAVHLYFSRLKMIQHDGGDGQHESESEYARK